MFVDNFFDSDSASDSVHFIERIRQNDEYIVSYDPFTRGLKNTNEPVGDPRGVFVRALRIRLDQIKHEWTQTVAIVRQSFGEYEPVLVCYPQTYVPFRAHVDSSQTNVGVGPHALFTVH